jgi:type I restriction enzyme, S subunit
MSDLPEGWITSVFDACNKFRSQTIDPAQFQDETFELYSVPSFPSKEPEIVKGREIGSTKQIVQPGDVLVCKINPRINRVWQVMPKRGLRQIASSEWIVMRSPEIRSTYLTYYFSSPDFRELICEGVIGVGGSLTRAQPANVATFPLLIAPLNEQNRIADKLDNLLARLDACRERLDRIPSLLKRFRQAVLAAATSGKLTEDWRQEALLPDWTTERADDVCAKVQSGGTPREGFIDTPGIPFLKVYNIVDQRVDFAYRPQFVSEDLHNGVLKKSQTQPGDVLMNIVGPPLGKVAVVPDTYPAWNINQAITLFRPTNRITSGWLYYFLCSGVSIAEIEHETRGSAGQTNISLSQCRNFLIPVPSIQEQQEVVRRVDILFAFADRWEARVKAAREAVDRLTPALLAKAFRGELVPQDPNDEPAAALLERIVAGQSNMNKSPRQKPIRPNRPGTDSAKAMPDVPGRLFD